MMDDWSNKPLNEEKQPEMGDWVTTPLGYGKVVDYATTPLGRVYRVETHSGVKDYFEQDVRMAEKDMALRSIMSSTKPYSKFHTSESQHYESVRKWGTLHTHAKPHTHKKKKSAIDPFLVSGENMYHGTHAKNVKNILEHGLLPHDHSGKSNSYYATDDPRMTPRPNHSYIGAEKMVNLQHDTPWVKVDMGKLDPNKVNTDEDWFDIPGELENFSAPHHVVNTYPPSQYEEPRWKPEHGTLGQWAENNRHWLDDPQNVGHSFTQGSVAVEGGVPSDAMTLNPNLSEDKYHELAREHGWEWVNQQLARSRGQRAASVKVSADISDPMRRPWIIQDWTNPTQSVQFGEPGTSISSIGIPADERGMPSDYMSSSPVGYINHGQVIPLDETSNQFIPNVQSVYNQKYLVKDNQMRQQMQPQQTKLQIGQPPASQGQDWHLAL